jgi:hypothetical protein
VAGQEPSQEYRGMTFFAELLDAGLHLGATKKAKISFLTG